MRKGKKKKKVQAVEWVDGREDWNCGHLVGDVEI